MKEEAPVVKLGVDVFDDRRVLRWNKVVVVELQDLRHGRAQRKGEGSKEYSGRQKDRVPGPAPVGGTDDVASGTEGELGKVLAI